MASGITSRCGPVPAACAMTSFAFTGFIGLAGSQSAAAAGDPAPDMFTIAVEDLVAPGIPGPGAGELEEPGSADIYEFTAVAGQSLFFQSISKSVVFIDWHCFGPNGDELFDTFFRRDRGPYLLTESGTYTVVVDDNNDAVGTYSFKVWETNTDTFEIDVEEVIDVDVPNVGAGFIEEPGDRDAYTFSGKAGQSLFFQSLDETSELRWSCVSPSRATLFESSMTVDQGAIELNETGTYTVVVNAAENNEATGAYSFVVWETNTDTFEIAIEDIVEPGVPGVGAGEIEEPGDADVYMFSAVAGQSLFFQSVSQSGGLDWRCTDPSGSTLFDSPFFDAGLFEITESGTYTVTFDDDGEDQTGTYTFVVWETNNDSFSIEVDELVAAGIPGPGAGDIEDPGDIDIYTFPASAGDKLYFQSLSQPGGLNWQCTGPRGVELFNEPFFFGQGIFSLTETGTYTLRVFDNGDIVGPYSFVVWDVQIDEFTIGLNERVDVDMPAAGAGNIAYPGNLDRYTINGTAGDTWCFKPLEADDNGIIWRLRDPNGVTQFVSTFFVNHPDVFITTSGEYVLDVFGDGDETSTYAFIVTENSAADLDDDCLVDFDDLVALIAAWGPCTNGDDCNADIDDDGDVGFVDLIIMLADWSNV